VWVKRTGRPSVEIKRSLPSWVAALRQQCSSTDERGTLEDSCTNHSFGESCSRHASTLPNTTPTPPAIHVRLMHAGNSNATSVSALRAIMLARPFREHVALQNVAFRPHDNPRKQRTL
jgi:hypothetical protein